MECFHTPLCFQANFELLSALGVCGLLVMSICFNTPYA